MESDAQLIELIQAGDMNAANALCLRYRQGLFGYLFLMLGNAQDAEDAVQDTLLQGLQYLRTYQEQGHFKAWLYRIGYRQGAKALKKRKRRPINESDLPENRILPEKTDPSRTPENAAIWSDASIQMRRALLNLPEKERVVLLLRIRSDLKFREIAEMLDCPLNTVLTRMHKATRKLKKALGGMES